MNRPETLLWRAAGIASLATALLTIHPQPAGAQNTKTQAVQVTNTPLPVQGAVTIGNLPTTPALVRDVDSYGRAPFQRFGTCQFTASATACGQPVLAEEASATRAQRAIIEHISVTASVPSGQRVGCELRVWWPDQNGVEQLNFDWFALTWWAVRPPFDALVARAQTRMYHLGDSNHRLYIVCTRTDSSGEGGFSYTVSGYFW